METIASWLAHWPSVLAVLLVLGGLIFFHELGHFFMARVLGIGVNTFSLGFGPKLLSRRLGKTDYCLSLIPLGGYVSLVGEEDDADADEQETAPHDPDAPVFTEAEEFFHRPPWQRLLVIAAGPAANFLAAWVLYTGLALFNGQTYMLPVVGGVMPESPAATAGLQAGDRILSIDGHDITVWSQVAERIAAAKGEPVRLHYERGNEERSLRLVPEAKTRKNFFGEDEPAWLIGVQVGKATAVRELGLFEALAAGTRQTWDVTELTVLGIAKLVQRVVPLDNVGGPIMIAQVVGQQAQQSLTGVLLLAALISINLGILNLLPIPVLDGGHIFFLTCEMILRRPVSATIRAFSIRMGMALLIGLMLFATWNDVMRLLS